MEKSAVPRWSWAGLPHEGCRGVEARVLARLPGTSLAQLRFEPGATIHEHASEIDIHVVCLEGSGFVSVGEDCSTLEAGEAVIWRSGERHRLWTEGSTMLTLMVELLAVEEWALAEPAPPEPLD
jgi:quercetin dioxygenase-like cupin family protein